MLGSIHSAISTPGRTPRVNPADDAEDAEDAEVVLSDEEKRDIVLRDPKWGMCSMMNYMLNRTSSRECSHVFGRQFCLPLIVFLAQWLMFAGLLMHNIKQPRVCGSKTLESKLLVVSISLIYFVNSFFLYDDIRDRSKQYKIACPSSYLVLIDAFQEHAFNLFVNIANLYIVFITEDFVDALFNSLALEFLMNMDNVYEISYFKYELEDAVYIYDNVFVVRSKSRENVNKKMLESFSYRIVRYITYVPFKILSWCFIALPVYCLVMLCFAVVCV